MFSCIFRNKFVQQGQQARRNTYKQQHGQKKQIQKGIANDKRHPRMMRRIAHHLAWHFLDTQSTNMGPP